MRIKKFINSIFKSNKKAKKENRGVYKKSYSFQKSVTWIIVIFIGFVFIFSGMFTPGSTIGSAYIGSVNGELIKRSEFNRNLSQQREAFGELFNDKEQNKLIRDIIFNQMVNTKIKSQAAENLGFIPSKIDVREVIEKMDVFKNEDKFDKILYKNLLKVNNISISEFESRVKESLKVKAFDDFLASFSFVTDEELKLDYKISNTKRKIKYVLFSISKIRETWKPSEKEINNFLSNKDNKSVIEDFREKDIERRGEFKSDNPLFNKFLQDERHKDIIENIKRGSVKPLSDREIATMLLREKLQESKIIQDVDKLSSKVIKIMTTSNKNDKKINNLLSKLGIKIDFIETNLKNKNQSSQKLENIDELLKDAFSGVISKKPKKYTSLNGTIVGIVVKESSPNWKKFDKKRKEKIKSKMLEDKKEKITLEFMNRLRRKSTIKRTKDVLGDDA